MKITYFTDLHTTLCTQTMATTKSKKKRVSTLFKTLKEKTSIGMSVLIVRLIMRKKVQK